MWIPPKSINSGREGLCLVTVSPLTKQILNGNWLNEWICQVQHWVPRIQRDKTSCPIGKQSPEVFRLKWWTWSTWNIFKYSFNIFLNVTKIKFCYNYLKNWCRIAISPKISYKSNENEIRKSNRKFVILSNCTKMNAFPLKTLSS